MTITVISHTFEDFGGSSLRYDAWVEEIPWYERKRGWAYRCRACGGFSRNALSLTKDTHARSHRKSIPDPATESRDGRDKP